MKNGLSWLPLSLLITLLVSANAHAQLYKWVAPNGKVTYSDTPPPSSASKVEEKTVSSAPAGIKLPFELAQAVKTSPVTLYTTSKCLPCEDARNFLNTRGVPFAEKTVNSNEDIARLKQVGGDQQLPFASIGSNKQSGFNSDLWETALTSAGYPASSQLPKTYRYPASSQLPKTYRNPAAESAAQKPKAVEPAKAADTTSTSTPATDSLPAAGNAPPGFRF